MHAGVRENRGQWDLHGKREGRENMDKSRVTLDNWQFGITWVGYMGSLLLGRV